LILGQSASTPENVCHAATLHAFQHVWTCPEMVGASKRA
jgi:hypothetical protein